jgi:hypothetical protein
LKITALVCGELDRRKGTSLKIAGLFSHHEKPNATFFCLAKVGALFIAVDQFASFNMIAKGHIAISFVDIGAG